MHAHLRVYIWMSPQNVPLLHAPLRSVSCLLHLQLWELVLTLDQACSGDVAAGLVASVDWGLHWPCSCVLRPRSGVHSTGQVACNTLGSLTAKAFVSVCL